MNGYSFQNPDEKYRGLDLWMVNDDLSDEEVKKQVYEFKEKGFYSVVFRTYNGLISDYPGPRFKSKVRAAIEAARECGLRIALQAGYMPSAYPDLPKEHALHRIVPVRLKEVTREDSVIATHGDIAFLDRLAPATVNMLSPTSVDYYIKKAYEETWAEFSEEYGKTVISVWLDEPRFDNRALTWSPDFDERFTARFGYSIKEELPSLYFDEGDYKRVRYDYFTFIREAMESCYYSKVREWCHAHGLSFAGHLMGEERLTMQIAQATCVMPFYKYFDVPGIDMLSSVHDWYDKPLVPYSATKRRFRERSMHVAAIQLTSIAEQTERALKLCEMYAVTSPSFVFRDQLHLFDFFAANGINHQCVHAPFYSPRGFRKRFYPQNFNRYSPFWENFRNVKDYVARVSEFISVGKPSVGVCVLHPLETAYGLFRGLIDASDETPRATVDDYDERYYRLIAQLYSTQTAFHFVSPSTLDSIGVAGDGILSVGAMDYSAIVLADVEVISAKTLDILRDLSSRGGRIYVKGALPNRLDGAYREGLSDELRSLRGVRVFDTNEELIRALRELECSYEYECEGDSSRTVINHRVLGDESYFLIHNGDCRREKRSTLTVRGIHSAFSFDGYTGRVTPLPVSYLDGKTVVRFTNPIGGSSMIFTSPVRSEILPCSGVHLSIPARSVEYSVEGKNLLTLELCTYKTENMSDFTSSEIAIERITERLKREQYKGMITLRFSFESDFEAKGLTLIAEDTGECDINLNGVPVEKEIIGHYSKTAAFEILRLPDAVRVGKNYLELTRYTEPPLATNPSDDMKHLFELFRMPKGVDLERVHLCGDFLVDAIPEYSQAAGCDRFAKGFMITGKAPRGTGEDVTASGYPFTPEPIEYAIKIDAPQDMSPYKRAVLKIGRYSGCSATVRIGERTVGFIDREPYTLEIDTKDLSPGENEIKIRLLGSFRNMFGPSHLLDYDPSECSRVLWYEDYENTDCTEYDTGNLTNSFQLIPYGIGAVSLELYP